MAKRVAWAGQTGLPMGQPEMIAHNGAAYVAAGRSGGTLFRSTNLIAWTNVGPSTSSPTFWRTALAGVVWSGSYFFAYDNAGSARSTGSASNGLGRSPDGLTWTVLDVSWGSGTPQHHALAAIGSTVLTLSKYGLSTVMRRSTDAGASFGTGTTPLARVNQLVARNSKFYAIGDTGTAANPRFCRSADGVTWTTFTLPGAAEYWNICFLSSGRIVVVTAAGATAYSDDDGATWAVGGTHAGIREYLNYTEAFGDTLVTIGAADYAGQVQQYWTSSDGAVTIDGPWDIIEASDQVDWWRLAAGISGEVLAFGTSDGADTLATGLLYNYVPAPRLRKTPAITVTPGNAGQPYIAPSTVCTPLPPPDDGGGSPPPTPTPALPYYVYVPNNPANPAAGEVRTQYRFHPGAGYTCDVTPQTYLVPDPAFPGGFVPVRERRCRWNYP